MTTEQAIKFMEETGKPVKLIAPESEFNNKGYYQLFNHDKICKLIPDTSCAALVWTTFTKETFLSYGKHDYIRFEEYVIE